MRNDVAATPLMSPPNGLAGMAFSPDGSMMAAAYRNAGLTLCNPTTAQPVAQVDGPCGPLAFSPDGKLLFCGGADGALLALDGKTAQERWRTPATGVRILSVSADARGRVTATGADGLVRFWSAADGSEMPGLAAFAGGA